MASMYNKLFTKILDSSIWLEPSPTRLVWLTFIAVMDEDGFAQFASVPNLAHRARVTQEEADLAVTCLESPDENSSDPENEGRRIERVPGGWMVLNADKYRALVTRERIKEQTRNRVAKHRELKRKCNASVTPSDSVAGSRRKAKEEEEGAAAPPPCPVVSLWNRIWETKVHETASRKKVIATRLRQEWRDLQWERAMAVAKRSAFCCGKNDRGWTADIDWFLKPDTAVKLLEGKYTDGKPPPTQNGPAPKRLNPDFVPPDERWRPKAVNCCRPPRNQLCEDLGDKLTWDWLLPEERETLIRLIPDYRGAAYAP